MVVKINRKPILVKEDEDKSWWERINWIYLTVSTCGYLLGLYALDLVSATFLGVHPFPFIRWIGVVLGWF